MKGLILGLILGASVTAFAEVTAPHFLANDAESVEKCISHITDATVVSFPLTEEGELNQAGAVCWPEGIK